MLRRRRGFALFVAVVVLAIAMAPCVDPGLTAVLVPLVGIGAAVTSAPVVSVSPCLYAFDAACRISTRGPPA
jgi:hypothetical protein